MKAVAVTQRVSVVTACGERRDCLDQAWTRFLAASGLLPVLLPNVPEVALALCEGSGIAGLVLTGGNDLAALGGDAQNATPSRMPCSIWQSSAGCRSWVFVAACK